MGLQLRRDGAGGKDGTFGVSVSTDVVIKILGQLLAHCLLAAGFWLLNILGDCW